MLSEKNVAVSMLSEKNVAVSMLSEKKEKNKNGVTV